MPAPRLPVAFIYANSIKQLVSTIVTHMPNLITVDCLQLSIRVQHYLSAPAAAAARAHSLDKILTFYPFTRVQPVFPFPTVVISTRQFYKILDLLLLLLGICGQTTHSLKRNESPPSRAAAAKNQVAYSQPAFLQTRRDREGISEQCDMPWKKKG